MSKPGRPNLSLAGKREAPTAQKPARGGATANRGARGRGGRGRGGGPRQKQELIQTGGVFSEGLGGDFPSRKKAQDVDSGQFAYSKRDRPAGAPSSSTSTSDDKKDEKKKANMAGKASFEGWDRMWRSDDEQDEVELNKLRPKSFVSDLKRGTIMPVVLPQEDQPQFQKVINKVARLSLDNEEFEEDKKPLKTDGTTEKPRKPTAEELIAILESARKNLLHMQLPSVIATICNNFEDASAGVAPMEVDDPENPTEPVRVSETVLGLPPGQDIGEIQVTKTGRIILKIKGHSIEMFLKPVAGKRQSTILLEVDPTDPAAMGPGSSRTSFENQLFHMGNVTHNLVGSMTWGELNNKEREEDVEKDGGEMEVELGESESDPEVRKRLVEAEKIQAGWFDDAESWAKGILNP